MRLGVVLVAGVELEPQVDRFFVDTIHLVRVDLKLPVDHLARQDNLLTALGKLQRLMLKLFNICKHLGGRVLRCLLN